jgi:hypothetical protein
LWPGINEKLGIDPTTNFDYQTPFIGALQFIFFPFPYLHGFFVVLATLYGIILRMYRDGPPNVYRTRTIAGDIKD